MNSNEYIKYIDSHTDEIAKYVDSCFEESRDSIKKKLIQIIKKYLTPIPIHYEKEDVYEDNPFDYSGIIVKDGYISLNQSVMDFLQNEYSGNKEPTFISGMGWHYNTYEDELSYETLSIAGTIMLSAIQRYIEDKFTICLSDEEFEEIQRSCGEFDDIYDNCMASEFFFCFPAINFVGISNIPLSAIIEKEI